MTTIASFLSRGRTPARPSNDGVSAPSDAAAALDPRWGTAALTLAVLLGVAFRLRMLLVGRSLWLDETMLALNICGRSFAGLFEPLDLDQGAPIGFLILEKLAVMAFGPTELALRLLPFLASLATLALLYRFCATNLGRWEAIVAVALAGVSPALIYYSGEVKQYGIDVAVGLAILVLAADAMRLGLSTGRAVGFALCGTAAVWVSHSSVFVLAAAGTTVILNELWAGRRGRALAGVGVAAFWLANFAVVYVLTLKDLGQNQFLEDFWDAGFLPLIPTSPGDVRRYLGVGFGLFRTLFFNLQSDVDLSSKMEVVMGVGWMVGVATLAASRERRPVLALLVGPIAVALLASMLHKYPLRDRLALFTAAATLPTIAAGFVGLIRSRDRTGQAAGVALLACCLALPSLQAIQFLAERPKLHGARNVLTGLARDWRPGDVAVVDRFSAPPFDFYQTYGGIPGLDKIRPVALDKDELTDPRTLAREIHAHSGQPRVWFILEADLSDKSDAHRQALKAILDDGGESLATHSSRRYSANLYHIR
ncbi:hypothetical protein TA3x_001150 [Tundrisphaera sp. TA3]|uniref:hypothetical protein n=1 Tax=Tundrisphaera sp. TA3 TaxID=3435775 RepID=UPI003EB70BD0